jgi:ADP-heptose:LPS heptosyltransferase
MNSLLRGRPRRLAASALVGIVRLATSPFTTIALGRILGTGDSREQETIPAADRRSILVVRSDGIGDVIMTGPFLRELRRAAPQARITLVVAPRSLNYVETCPYVDRVLTVQIPPPRNSAETWWRPLSRRVAAISVARRHLRRERYELALVPRWGEDNHEASVLAYLSGAPERAAYSEHVSPQREKRNRGYDRFFTMVVRDRSVKHEVERNLDFLSILDAEALDLSLEAWLSTDDENFADQVLASAGTPMRVAIGPGAGSAMREWPIERFVEVGRWLIDRGGSLVVVGGAGEVLLGDRIRRSLGSRVLDLTNKATLRETIATLKQCSMFCGNDAGTLHLAAAAGIPVVEVSCHPRGGDDLHANSPKRFAPWGVPHRILQPEHPALGCSVGCRASAPHCILNVPVSSVIRAMNSLIDERSIRWTNASTHSEQDSSEV